MVVALVFQKTLVIKKEPANMFMAAHHCVTLSEFFNDEILVSLNFLTVCTYEIAEEVKFFVLNSIMKLKCLQKCLAEI